VHFYVEDQRGKTVTVGTGDSDLTVTTGTADIDENPPSASEIVGDVRMGGVISSGLPSGGADADTLLEASVRNTVGESKGIRWSDWKNRQYPKAVLD